MRKTKFLFVSIIFIFLFSSFLKSEDLTLADVAAVQKANSENIETMAAEVENEVEYGGNKQILVYDYILQNNPDGSNKMMVSTKGVFTMQFLVDTKEGSVTYLMADGSVKKWTLSQEEKENLFANYQLSVFDSPLQNIYAKAIKNPLLVDEGKIATDGTYSTMLDKDTLETDEYIIKVKGQKNIGRKYEGYAYVEFHNKKTKDIGKQIDEKIAEVEKVPATKNEAKNTKAKFIAQMKKNKDKVIKTTIAKRVEKVNMKTGQVEETEFFNGNGEKIGFIRVKNSSKFKVQSSKVNTQSNNTKEISIPIETEGEMESIDGKSKFKTKMKDIKINEEVEFKWQKPKKR